MLFFNKNEHELEQFINLLAVMRDTRQRSVKALCYKPEGRGFETQRSI
jgi:hypothetical protein